MNASLASTPAVQPATNAAQPQATPVVNSDASPFEQAMAALRGSQSGDPADSTASQAGATVPPVEKKPATPPEPKKPEETPPDAAALLVKANNQAAMLRRQQTKFENERREFESERAKVARQLTEVQGLKSMSAIVAFVAKQSGVSETEVWQDFVDQAKNNGQPTKDSAALAEIRALKAEREAEKEAARKREVEESQRATQAQQERMQSEFQSGIASAIETTPETYPSIAELPDVILHAACLDVWYQDYRHTYDPELKTGIIAKPEEVLQYLESQAVAKKRPAGTPAAKQGAAPRQAKPTIPSNQDASASGVDTREMTREEREREAAKLLRSMTG